MKIFRVVVEMPDGPTKKVKGTGKRETPLRNEETFYAASSMQEVWDHIQEALQTFWAEGKLIKVEEAAPLITILNSPAEGECK